MVADALAAARPSGTESFRDTILLFQALRAQDADGLARLLTQHPVAGHRHRGLVAGRGLRVAARVLGAGDGADPSGRHRRPPAGAPAGRGRRPGRRRLPVREPRERAVGGGQHRRRRCRRLPARPRRLRRRRGVRRRVHRPPRRRAPRAARSRAPAAGGRGRPGRHRRPWPHRRGLGCPEGRPPGRGATTATSCGPGSEPSTCSRRCGEGRWCTSRPPTGSARCVAMLGMVDALAPAHWWMIGFEHGPYEPVEFEREAREQRHDRDDRPHRAGRPRRPPPAVRRHPRAARRRRPAPRSSPACPHRDTSTTSPSAFPASPPIRRCWRPSSWPPTPPSLPPVPEALPEGFDARITFDPARARARRWPAIDPDRTSARTYPDERHEHIARAARDRPRRLRRDRPRVRVCADPSTFDDPAAAERAQALVRYLTHSFRVVELFSALPGGRHPDGRGPRHRRGPARPLTRAHRRRPALPLPLPVTSTGIEEASARAVGWRRTVCDGSGDGGRSVIDRGGKRRPWIGRSVVVVSSVDQLAGFDLLPGAVLVAVDLVVVYANPAALELFGVADLPRTVEHRERGRPRACRRCCPARRASGGDRRDVVRPDVGRIRIVRPDGTVRVVDWTMRWFMLGSRSAVLHVVDDITPRPSPA